MRVELSYNPDAGPRTTGVDHDRTWNAVDNRILGTDQLDSEPLTDSGTTAEVIGGVDFDGSSGVGGEDEEGIQLTTQHSRLNNNANSSSSSSGGSGLTVFRAKKKVKSAVRSSGEYKALNDEDEDVEQSAVGGTADDHKDDDEEVQQQSLLRPVSEVDGHKNKLYANIWKFCLIGMPGYVLIMLFVISGESCYRGLMLSIDCWSYELCALFAAQLGNISLDCYIILVLTIK